MIFPKKKWKNKLTYGALTETLGSAQESDWMTNPKFSKICAFITREKGAFAQQSQITDSP